MKSRADEMKNMTSLPKVSVLASCSEDPSLNLGLGNVNSGQFFVVDFSVFPKIF